MAGQKGQKHNLKRNKPGPLTRSVTQKRYFYIEGDLYKIIRADRANNLTRAWSYTDTKIVDFVYTDVVRRSQQAFDTEEVCRLLNRTKQNVLAHVKAGAINAPTKIYEQKDNPETKRFGYYKWSEDDVLAMHSFYLTLGSGRPRKDGMVFSAVRIPTRLELIAMIKQHKMYYVQDSSGNFVPIFDQPDWT